MLRWFVLALLLANLAFWAWSEGWFVAPLGMGPAVQREPARLARQVQPDSIRVLSPAPAWTEGRDFPAPEGRTFRELYRERRPTGSRP